MGRNKGEEDLLGEMGKVMLAGGGRGVRLHAPVVNEWGPRSKMAVEVRRRE